MKRMRPVSARLTMMCGKQQMLVSAAMVPTVAPGLSQDCRNFQPSPAFLKPSNQVAMRRQFALTLDMAKVSLPHVEGFKTLEAYFTRLYKSCQWSTEALLGGGHVCRYGKLATARHPADHW